MLCIVAVSQSKWKQIKKIQLKLTVLRLGPLEYIFCLAHHQPFYPNTQIEKKSFHWTKSSLNQEEEFIIDEFIFIFLCILRGKCIMVCLVKNALFIVWKQACFMFVYASIFNILHMTMTHATKCNVLSLPQIWQLFLPCDSPDVCNVIMTGQTSFTYFSTYLYLEILAVWNVFYSVCVVCPSMGASVSRPFLKSPHWPTMCFVLLKWTTRFWISLLLVL